MIGRYQVALTGGLGTGKSMVLKIFKQKGATTLDSDEIVRNALDKNKYIQQRIINLFGSSVAKGSKGLNKPALAKIIFSSTMKRKILEKLLHPIVKKVIEGEYSKSKKKIVVCDVPLLFETGWDKNFDSVIVVEANQALRMKRLRKRGMSVSDIRSRIKSQIPLSQKIKKADFVIHNNGTVRQTKKQVDTIWNNLKGDQWNFNKNKKRIRAKRTIRIKKMIK